MIEPKDWTMRRVIWTAFWRYPRFTFCTINTWVQMKLRLLGDDPPRGLAVGLAETWHVSKWLNPWTKETGPVDMQWVVTVYARQKHQDFIVDAFHCPVEDRSHVDAPYQLPVKIEGEFFARL